jgi:hypothetical protein
VKKANGQIIAVNEVRLGPRPARRQRDVRRRVVGQQRTAGGAAAAAASGDGSVTVQAAAAAAGRAAQQRLELHAAAPLWQRQRQQHSALCRFAAAGTRTPARAPYTARTRCRPRPHTPLPSTPRQIHEKHPTTVKNFGIWVRYQSRTGYHNMYKVRLHRAVLRLRL